MYLLPTTHNTRGNTKRMYPNEFKVNFPDLRSFTALITDIRLLTPDLLMQLRRSKEPDVRLERATETGGNATLYIADQWHIATGLPLKDAQHKLTPLFETYVEGYCAGIEIGVSVEVDYIGAGGTSLYREQYRTGQVKDELHVRVYTTDFWSTRSLATANWVPVLMQFAPLGPGGYTTRPNIARVLGGERSSSHLIQLVLITREQLNPSAAHIASAMTEHEPKLLEGPSIRGFNIAPH